MIHHSTITTFLFVIWASVSSAQVVTPTALPAPGQPTKTGTPLTFEIVGKSGVSAQQMFLGTENTVRRFGCITSTRQLLTVHIQGLYRRQDRGKSAQSEKPSCLGIRNHPRYRGYSSHGRLFQFLLRWGKLSR